MRTLILSNLDIIDWGAEGMTSDTIAVVDMTKELIDLYVQAPRDVKLSILDYKWVILEQWEDLKID